MDTKAAIIRPIAGEDEARACAEFMAASDPWKTLRITAEKLYGSLSSTERESHVALLEGNLTGIIHLDMHGLLCGYIKYLAVRPEYRGGGVGATLLKWAEERIFAESPNVFLCVSSFNEGALRLYRRHGFEPVGPLKNFAVSGHDEFLLRKTRGSWEEYRR